MKTVHVVGGLSSYESMFHSHGWELVNTVREANLVQFCGGPDVWPGFYGEKSIDTTQIDLDRDTYEKAIWDMALKQGCAIAGICRGAQFVHVMNGGGLYQHVSGHLGVHRATIVPKDLKFLWPTGLLVSSSHHQMIRCDKSKGLVILEASMNTFSKHGENGLLKDKKHYKRDIEAIFHSKTRSLCYQPHPEYFESGHPCNILYFQLINRLLFPKKGKK